MASSGAAAAAAAASAIKGAASAAAKMAVDIFATAKAAGASPAVITALQDFRRRHEDLRSRVSQLESSRLDVDFESYRQVLRNKDILEKAEKAAQGFRPRELDTKRKHEIIAAYEARALKEAEMATTAVSACVGELKETLENIDTARSVDNLTLRNYLDAMPEVETEMEFRNKHQYFELDPNNLFLSKNPDALELIKAAKEKKLQQVLEESGH